MPHHTDNPPEPAWTEFAPLQSDAQGSAPGKTEPPIRKRGGCQFCSSRKFLRSGLRAADIGTIFLLHYPVRCLRCRQRQFTDFLTASMAQAAGSPVYHNNAKKRENWGSWTSGSDREIADAWDKLQELQNSDIPPGNR